MKFNKNEFGWKEKVNINTDELVTKNDIPHYNETLMFEISGDDYRFFMNNNYFNMSALNIDETKSYIVKDISDEGEYTFKFVYDKEAEALICDDYSTNIYNHKSYNGENFIEDENSAVLTFDITPMDLSEFEGERYFRLYEIDKVELDGNCLPKDVSIKNSLTVGTRIGDIGEFSVAEGDGNTASGEYSHAEGDSTTASSYVSHAEGCGTTSSALASHAEGNYTTASGNSSHSEGNNTTASGVSSHSEGNNTTASGGVSHAEGRGSTASGMCSHAEGNFTIASSDYQHVQGKYNINDTANKYAHIVGNGTSNNARSNAHTLDWQGNGWYKGKLSQDGTPTEDKDLTTKKYVDDKTKILPVKNTYTIFEDAVPHLQEEDYIFDSLQNEDMIISAIKFNLNVTFNDGTNDITKNLILKSNGDGCGFYEGNDIIAVINYYKTEHSICMDIIEPNKHITCNILRATLSCDIYSNLLQNHLIQNIDYNKIEDVPLILSSIVNGKNRTLQGKEYYNLFDNLFIWDTNKFNERLDENSGVKQNLTIGHIIQVKQKDGEGIGFG